MKNIRIFPLLSLLAALFLFTACGSKLTNENLGKVQTQMTEEEVKAILGAPTKVETGSVLGITGTTYYYKSGASEVKIVFVNSKVMMKEGSFN